MVVSKTYNVRKCHPALKLLPMKTIKDVARLAGVSPATVSRALNKGSSVNERTRQRVLNAVAELNYRPDANARALVNRSTKTLGVVISELADPFFARMIHSIQLTAKKLNFKVLISTGSMDADREMKAIKNLLAQRCDAIVVNSKALSKEQLITLAEENPAFVLINEYIHEIRERCIWFDNIRGGQLMAEYALSMGHKEFVVFSTRNKDHDASRRLKGIRAALQSQGIKLPIERIIHATPDYAGGQRAVEDLQLTKFNYSVILCYNDAMATGAISKLLDCGYSIPKDVSLLILVLLMEMKHIGRTFYLILFSLILIKNPCLGVR